MAFVRRAPKRVQHLLLVLFVAAALLVPLQVVSAPVSAAPLPVQLSVGQLHACALSAGGIAQCWGNNDTGSVGNNSTSSFGTPQPVSQGSVTYTSISSGSAHTCALSPAGQTYCWGYGALGRLGYGSSTDRMTPIAVTQSGVTYSSLSLGGANSCALTSAGQAYCWGAGSSGQNGDGGTSTRTTPVAVTQGGVIFNSLAAGGSHVCGLTAGGQAYCWGAGLSGQIGNGGTANQTTPVAVTQGGVSFVSLAAGDAHTCGLTSGGQAYCWGAGANGRLGNGGLTNQTTPVVVTQSGVVLRSLTAGFSHTCGVTAAGQGYCWGANAYGALGDGTTTDRSTPVTVSQSSLTFSNLTTGNEATSTCAVSLTSERVYCWGERSSGRIGDNVNDGQALKPVPVAQSALTFTSIAEGANHTCALASGGQVYCWGENNYAQLGIGTYVNQAVPAAVTQGGITFVAITVGQFFSCGLTGAGQAYCWGQSSSGQVGNGSTSVFPTPTAVTQGGVTYTSIASGSDQTCGLTSGGQAYCWGYNVYGQIGNGGGGNQLTPAAVTQGGVTYSSLTGAGDSECALTAAGQAYCWGAGTYGQLGNGGGVNASTPAAVSQGGITYSSISGGFHHACALTSAGQGYCWGYGSAGRLGNGVSAQQNSPVAVLQSGVVFTSISGGYQSTCALAVGGQGYCWGTGTGGQLGSGQTINRTTPLAVAQSATFTSLVSSNLASHSCALTSTGKAYCWGYDAWGQLGMVANPLTPVASFYLVDSEGASASASIDPSFTFSIAGRAAACNGASTPTGAATPSAIDLGHLSSASPVLGAQDFTAATNAGSGFSVSVKFSGPLTSTSGATFANASGSAGTPTAFGSSEAFGYTTSANAGFSGPLWAGPTTSYASLYTTSAPTASVSNCIAYQAQAGPLTPAGNYSVTVIYLATPTF